MILITFFQNSILGSFVSCADPKQLEEAIFFKINFFQKYIEIPLEGHTGWTVDTNLCPNFLHRLSEDNPGRQRIKVLLTCKSITPAH